jgi:Uma2 family endonuclease
VKEHWIVLAPERRVEVYRQPQQRYQETRVFGPGDTVECIGLPGIHLGVSALFG